MLYCHIFGINPAPFLIDIFKDIPQYFRDEPETVQKDQFWVVILFCKNWNPSVFMFCNTLNVYRQNKNSGIQKDEVKAMSKMTKKLAKCQ